MVDHRTKIIEVVSEAQREDIIAQTEEDINNRTLRRFEVESCEVQMQSWPRREWYGVGNKLLQYGVGGDVLMLYDALILHYIVRLVI